MTTYQKKSDEKDFARKHINEYYNESYIADDVTLGPFCSAWVHDIKKEYESKLEKEVKDDNIKKVKNIP
jgi:hypothetical protein